MTLLSRLPDEALIQTLPEERERRREGGEWGTDTELLAQVVELMSVLASDHRTRKPVEVPRPAWVRAPKRMRTRGGNGGPDPAFASAIDGLLGTTRSA